MQHSGQNVCTAHMLVTVLQGDMNVVITTCVWTTLPPLAAVSFTFFLILYGSGTEKHILVFVRQTYASHMHSTVCSPMSVCHKPMFCWNSQTHQDGFRNSHYLWLILYVNVLREFGYLKK